MARRRTSNTLAVFTWVLGLLGYAGYFNHFGFFALIIPLLFWMFGNRLAKDHCRIYFNVLLTAFIIFVVGAVLNFILDLIKLKTFDFTYLGLIYFALMSIFGLLAALNNRKYRLSLSVQVF